MIRYILIGAAIVFGLSLVIGAATAIALCRASAHADRYTPSPDSRATPLGSVQHAYPTAHEWRRL